MFESFTKAESDQGIVTQSIARDLQNIESMGAQIDAADLARAVELLADAEVVHLAGIASAEALVDLTHAYLEALKKPTKLLKGFGITKRAELIDFAPGQVVIGFSFQRVLREVRDLFSYVRGFGVSTIAVTDSPLNALAAEADVTLVSPVIGTTFALSHVAPLALINLLINSLAARDTESSLLALREAKDEWEKRPIFCKPRQGAG